MGPFLTAEDSDSSLPPHRFVPPLSDFPLPALAGDAYLLMELGGGHLLQVLQVGVEEPAADEGHAQQGLHDVADGAVVRQPDALGCAHEVAPAAGGEGRAREPGRTQPGTKEGNIAPCGAARRPLLGTGWQASSSAPPHPPQPPCSTLP